MGGSGGGGYFIGRTPEEIKSELRKEESRTQDQAFDVEMAEEIGQLLAQANTRDADAISNALDEIKRVLERDIEGSMDPRFGGVEEIAGAAVLRVQLGTELPAVVMRRAELLKQRLDREHFFHGSEIARDGADLAAGLSARAPRSR